MNNTATATKKKKPASLDKKKARSGWLFVLPFVIGFVVLYLPMLYRSIEFSFSEITILRTGGYSLEHVGFYNYYDALFSDASYLRVLTSSLKQLVLDVPAIVIFALFMAIILNQKMFGRAVFRAIFFIPVILTTGLIDSIDQSNAAMTYMSSGSIDTGAGANSNDIINAMDVTNLLGNMVIGTELVEYVVGVVNNIFNIVNRSGVQMLIFLAGLQSISPSIYESCKMDGASGWETFWKVTIPSILHIVVFVVIYTIVDVFLTSQIAQEAYAFAFEQNKIGIGSALSVVYIFNVLIVLGIVLLFTRKVVSNNG